MYGSSKYCSVNAEATGSNPVETPNFFFSLNAMVNARVWKAALT